MAVIVSKRSDRSLLKSGKVGKRRSYWVINRRTSSEGESSLTDAGRYFFMIMDYNLGRLSEGGRDQTLMQNQH